MLLGLIDAEPSVVNTAAAPEFACRGASLPRRTSVDERKEKTRRNQSFTFTLTLHTGTATHFEILGVKLAFLDIIPKTTNVQCTVQFLWLVT